MTTKLWLVVGNAPSVLKQHDRSSQFSCCNVFSTISGLFVRDNDNVSITANNNNNDDDDGNNHVDKRWGLVPSFTKKDDKPDFFRMFNARSETVGHAAVNSHASSCRGTGKPTYTRTHIPRVRVKQHRTHVEPCAPTQ